MSRITIRHDTRIESRRYRPAFVLPKSAPSGVSSSAPQRRTTLAIHSLQGGRHGKEATVRGREAPQVVWRDGCAHGPAREVSVLPARTDAARRRGRQAPQGRRRLAEAQARDDQDRGQRRLPHRRGKHLRRPDRQPDQGDEQGFSRHQFGQIADPCRVEGPGHRLAHPVQARRCHAHEDQRRPDSPTTTP